MTVRLLALLAFFFATAVPASADEPAKSAYDFGFTSIEGESMPLSKLRGKVVLVVNTASFCGFTRQYGDLQAVWEEYRDRGLVVVGVPSNDFGNQEPGTEAEIKSFCEVNFDIDFPLTTKQKVVGETAHPFYVWAAGQAGPEGRPRWNFHKYLIGPDGQLAGWFPTRTAPTAPSVTEAIEVQLKRIETPGGAG
jgi:glutathione peroxidase